MSTLNETIKSYIGNNLQENDKHKSDGTSEGKEIECIEGTYAKVFENHQSSNSEADDSYACVNSNKSDFQESSSNEDSVLSVFDD